MKIGYSLGPEARSYNFRTPRMLAQKASKVQKSGHFCCFLSNDMHDSPSPRDATSVVVLRNSLRYMKAMVSLKVDSTDRLLSY